MYDKVFYSITAREIILEWDKTACRFVSSYWTWTWTWTCLFLKRTRTWTCPFKVDLDLDLDLRIGDLDLDLDLAVAGLVTSLASSTRMLRKRITLMLNLRCKLKMLSI